MNPEKVDRPALNQKEIEKICKLSEAKTVYFCECGKNYLSFAALYLHVRTKHNFKLTSKISPEVCKIVHENGV